MRSPASSSCLAVVLAIMGLVSVDCAESEFLSGVECSNSDQCGPSLGCQNGFCGGCPEDLLDDTGECLCPGERILDCRALQAPRCMPVCESTADELCLVLEVLPTGETREIRRCPRPQGMPCFSIMVDQDDCPEGEALIQVSEVDAQQTIVVNCPPPESEESEFDCEPE